MNRITGFSTGALAFGEFRRALDILRRVRGLRAVELSALRQSELAPLRAAADFLDLSQYSYIAVHAPSQLGAGTERHVVTSLMHFARKGWTVVAHPDVIQNHSLWRALGTSLCLENMDKRKPVARTVDELKIVFEELPDAGLCFDLGHARQVDASMTEAYLIARTYVSKMRQVHISEVNTRSKHDRLSYSSIVAFQRVAEFIPESVPVIIESVIEEGEIEPELERVEEALLAHQRVA